MTLSKRLALPIHRRSKVLLHTHLEGSIPKTTLDLLCRRNKVSHPHLLRAVGSGPLIQELTWDDFLRLYFQISSCFQNREDFRDAIRTYGAALARDHVVYAEVQCSPWNHLLRGVDLDDIADGLYVGMQDAREHTGVTLKVILDLTRTQGEDATRLLDWMTNLPRSHFVGLGISGGPGSIPLPFYRSHCERARSAGFGVVVHAGELEGPESVRTAMDLLHANRISHGVRALEDADLIREIIDRQVHLELCPTSNQILHIGRPNYFSIGEIINRGVNCSINSDDNLIFGTTLTKEYMRLLQSRIIDSSTVTRLLLNAISVAFLSEGERLRFGTAISGQ